MSTTYSAGTVSIGATSTSLTGAGTAWLSSGVQAGDLLLLAGLSVRIASVDSNTAITLARAWPGSTQSSVNYDILMLDDNVRTLTAANALLQTLSNGTLSSLAGQSSSANKMPYFAGSNTFALADLTPAARAILALTGTPGARLPVVTGAGAADLRDILGTVSQSSGVPTGAIVETGSNANGTYSRWADGTQIATKRFSGLGPISTSDGAVWRSAATVVGSFAADFIAQPFMSIRTGRGGGDRTWGMLLYFQASYGPGNNGSLMLCAPASNAGTDFYADITAVGRWF